MLFVSCNNSDGEETEPQVGNVFLKFEHFADDAEVEFDEMKYTNAAGNEYEVTEIQWFVSDISLNAADGGKLVLGEEKFAHYVDTNLPETFTWSVPDDVPTGEYTSISMTFGIKGEKKYPNDVH